MKVNFQLADETECIKGKYYNRYSDEYDSVHLLIPNSTETFCGIETEGLKNYAPFKIGEQICKKCENNIEKDKK